MGCSALNNHSIARKTCIQIDDFVNKYNMYNQNLDYILNIEVVKR